jgi:hypothetical protein
MTTTKITNVKDLRNGDLARFEWPDGSKMTGRVEILDSGQTWLTFGYLGTGGRTLITDERVFVSAKRTGPEAGPRRFPEGTRVMQKSDGRLGNISSLPDVVDGYGLRVHVHWDNGSKYYTWPDDLEAGPWSIESPFQEGTRVQDVFLPSSFGVVTRDATTHGPVSVEWDNGTGGWCPPASLRKVPLQPGDRVKIRDGAGPGYLATTIQHRGGTGTVERVNLAQAYTHKVAVDGKPSLSAWFEAAELTFAGPGPAAPKPDVLDVLREKLGEALKILEDGK